MGNIYGYIKIDTYVTVMTQTRNLQFLAFFHVLRVPAFQNILLQIDTQYNYVLHDIRKINDWTANDTFQNFDILHELGVIALGSWAISAICTF